MATSARSTGSMSDTLGTASGINRFGAKVAARLSEGTLPDWQLARLEAARHAALVRRQQAVAQAVRPPSGRLPSWLKLSPRGLKLASVAPLIVLAAGLWTINRVTHDTLASDIAQVEWQLLTSKLPLAAYTDPGFAEFVRRDRQSEVADDAPV